MPIYIAFLRAINVGGHTVKMDQLRRSFERLGFAAVETFIASGNVIFESSSKNTAALEKKIEDSLQAELGYRPSTFLRTVTEVAEIAACNPFPESIRKGTDTALYIGFMPNRPAKSSEQNLLNLSTDTDVLRIHDREIYWLCRTKFSESAISGALLEKALGLRVTLRNSTTVKRIAAKYS